MMLSSQIDRCSESEDDLRLRCGCDPLEVSVQVRAVLLERHPALTRWWHVGIGSGILGHVVQAGVDVDDVEIVAQPFIHMLESDSSVPALPVSQSDHLPVFELPYHRRLIAHANGIADANDLFHSINIIFLVCSKPCVLKRYRYTPVLTLRPSSSDPSQTTE